MTSTQAVPGRHDAATAQVEVLLYSDDSATRAEVRQAVGRRAGADLPPIAWTETATHAAVVEHAESGRFTLLVLDGEAAKAGGLGVCRQLKAEIYECPRIVVLIARPQDAWLAAWSEADAVISAPLDPLEVRDVIANQLREARA